MGSPLRALCVQSLIGLNPTGTRGVPCRVCCASAHLAAFHTLEVAPVFAIGAGAVLFREGMPLEQGVFMLVLLQDRHYRLFLGASSCWFCSRIVTIVCRQRRILVGLLNNTLRTL